MMPTKPSKPSLDSLLDDYPVVIETPVAWGDMDAFGHVNNTRYFRYFEDARMAYFEKLAIPALTERTGIGPILASTSCKFRIPLSYPDTVSVGARISEIEADRFLMQYRVISHQWEKVAAEGDGMIVSFDYREKQKAAVPAELREAIERIEGLGRK